MNTLIIDCDNLLHRVYHTVGNKEDISSSSIIVERFLNTMISYIGTFSPDRVITVWDKKLSPGTINFRKKLIPTYKGTRPKGDTMVTLYKSCDIARELVELLGIKSIFPNVLEADDIISWLVEYTQDNITIISSDSDLYQLVSDRVCVYNAIKKITVTPSTFESIVGIKQSSYILWKSIKGDSTDNINGLDGYGEKKAKIAVEQGDVFIKGLNEQQRADLNIFKEVIDLHKSYLKEPGEEEIYISQYSAPTQLPNMREFRSICDQHGIDNINTYKLKGLSVVHTNNVINTFIQGLNL